MSLKASYLEQDQIQIIRIPLNVQTTTVRKRGESPGTRKERSLRTRGKSLVEQQELRELRIPPRNAKARVPAPHNSQGLAWRRDLGLGSNFRGLHPQWKPQVDVPDFVDSPLGGFHTLGGLNGEWDGGRLGGCRRRVGRENFGMYTILYIILKINK